MTPPSKRPRRVGVLLVILPLWLLASGGVAVWYFFKREKTHAAGQQQRFVRSVSVAGLADDLGKFVGIIGERHASSDSAAKNLARAAAMIEGALGPANTGYTVRRQRGPGDWPLLHATLGGKNPGAPAVWVLSSYDSRPGSPGAEANASGLAATLATAQALAGDQLATDVHFVFLPHVNDPDSPVLETALKFHEILAQAAPPKALLCVEAMGAGDLLWLTSRDVEAAPLALAQGLGTVRGAEVVCLGDDVDLASVLFEMGLPAVRVATRPMLTPAEPDSKVPAAPIVAASTGRLIELIRRCAITR
ncbi:MAG: M28 family peptidase [Luteolibacter sp.]|nr:M28 family peptidase [Luteolibacter sp.]